LKLIAFKIHTEQRFGAIVGDKIVDLNSAYTLMLKETKGIDYARRLASAVIPPSLTGFLESGEEGLNAAKSVFAWLESKSKDLTGVEEEKIFLNTEEVRIGPPVPYPGKIYCAAVNYYDHATESIKDPVERKKEIDRLKSLNLKVADCFQKQPSLVVGPTAPIIKPKVSERLDYECELAVVIGKKGKDIPPEKVYEHIAGYTILIDVSFRDQGFPRDVEFGLFKRDTNWTKGKGMDNACPIGPCIVTSDEIKDPFNPALTLITRVNGKTRQNGSVENMIIKIPNLVSYMSRGATLKPGDLIATGTCGGVASSWGPEGFLKVGDVLECEIQPIGVQKHIVIADTGPI
jgi:acylpyruvate hydrolase